MTVFLVQQEYTDKICQQMMEDHVHVKLDIMMIKQTQNYASSVISLVKVFIFYFFN
jgi:hypothetical protein